MLKKIMKFFTCTCSSSASKNGEKGFTLIELLVVIAILGVLAAVAVPSVASLMTAGDLSAAKAEAASVQTAIDACLTQGKTPQSPAGPGTLAAPLGDYIRGSIKGTYTIDAASGIITAATSGWGSTITWSTGNNTWVK